MNVYNSQAEMETINDGEERRTCFVCGFPSGVKNYEFHHIFPGLFEEGVQLCINCHDMLDRHRFKDTKDISWFMRMMNMDGKWEGAPAWCKILILLLTSTLSNIENVE